MANYSSQGVTATFKSVSLGRITNTQVDPGVVPLDETTLAHTRENNQAGIETFSGSIDCIGDAAAVSEGDIGSLAIGGTKTRNCGVCLLTTIGEGTPVKGSRTVRYTFIASVET